MSNDQQGTEVDEGTSLDSQEEPQNTDSAEEIDNVADSDKNKSNNKDPLLGTIIREREEDINANSFYLALAKWSAIGLFIASLALTAVLLSIVVGREERVSEALQDYASVLSRCEQHEAKSDKSDSKKANKAASANSKDTASQKAKQPADRLAGNASKSSDECNQLKYLAALVNGSGLSLTPFVYINIVLYFSAVFLVVSVARVRFYRTQEEEKDFQTFFSPLVEIIKEIIDYIKSK